jgi:hypothetical protein
MLNGWQFILVIGGLWIAVTGIAVSPAQITLGVVIAGTTYLYGVYAYAKARTK